jgi:hypothetical protein
MKKNVLDRSNNLLLIFDCLPSAVVTAGQQQQEGPGGKIEGRGITAAGRNLASQGEG